MATLGSINHVQLDKIGAINNVSIGKAAALNHVDIASAAPATLSASPLSFQLDLLGRVCVTAAANQTITVTASAGNTWTASVSSGTTWVMIDGSVNGTATDTGSGSFTMDAGRLLSGSRSGSVIITSDAPNVTISILQAECPV